MFLVLALVFVLLFPSVSNTANPKEEFNKIQEQIQEQKKRLTETLERESSVLNELDSVNIKLSKVEADLRKYRKILRQTESEIETVNSEIAKTRESLAKAERLAGEETQDNAAIRIRRRYGDAPDERRRYFPDDEGMEISGKPDAL